MQAALTFIVPAGFYHPRTHTYVRLLGPCFKMGRIISYYHQQPWHSMSTLPLNNMLQFKCTACVPPRSKKNWGGRGQPKIECVMTPLLDVSLHTTSYNTSQNQLTSCKDYHSLPTAPDAHCWEMWQFCSEDRHMQFIWIRTMHVTNQNCLNLVSYGFFTYSIERR